MQCYGSRPRHFCCPWDKAMPKCGWFDFYYGKCSKNGSCPGGSDEIVGPARRWCEVGSTRAT